MARKRRGPSSTNIQNAHRLIQRSPANLIRGGDKAEAVPWTKITRGRTVTTHQSSEEVLKALDADPKVALEYDKAARHQGLRVQQLTPSGANKSLQAEAEWNHWSEFSWRPFVGVCFGLLGLITGLAVIVAYVGVIFFKKDAAILASLPGMLGAVAVVMGTMASILGGVSWLRRRMCVTGSAPQSPDRFRSTGSR